MQRNPAEVAEATYTTRSFIKGFQGVAGSGGVTRMAGNNQQIILSSPPLPPNLYIQEDAGNLLLPLLCLVPLRDPVPQYYVAVKGKGLGMSREVVAGPSTPCTVPPRPSSPVSEVITASRRRGREMWGKWQ